MNTIQKIAIILRAKGGAVCLEKAKELEAGSTQNTSLHFRGLNLNARDANAIAELLLQEKGDDVKSISFSYNPKLGDDGLSAIAPALPSSLTELGLVACGLGDQGGAAVLHWMKKASELQMICIENNAFSEHLKEQFVSFRNSHPSVVVSF